VKELNWKYAIQSIKLNVCMDTAIQVSLLPCPSNTTALVHRKPASPYKGKGKVHPRTGHEGPESE
jgi:hypothetical protein